MWSRPWDPRDAAGTVRAPGYHCHASVPGRGEERRTTTRLAEHRVLVTGGAGFLGRHVVRALQAGGCRDMIVPRRQQYDLTTEAAVARMYEATRPRLNRVYGQRAYSLYEEPPCSTSRRASPPSWGRWARWPSAIWSTFGAGASSAS